VTTIAKHMARKPVAVANSTDAQVQTRNKQLRARFSPRPAELWWPHTTQTLEATLRRLTSSPFVPQANGTRAGRRRGVTKLLGWLSSFPGDTWQQRWLASGAEDHPGAAWTRLVLEWLRERGESASYDPEDLPSGLLMLICGDVMGLSGCLVPGCAGLSWGSGCGYVVAWVRRPRVGRLRFPP
jgi:hypothetical protein